MERLLLTKPINPIVSAANRRELEEYLLRTFVNSILDSWIGMAELNPEKERELEELKKLKEKVDLLKKGTLREFATEMQDLQVSLIKDPNAKKLMKQLVRECRKFINLASRFEKVFYFSRPIKSVRVNLLKIIYGEKLMRYSFFMGITAISLFSILNFI